MLRVQIERNWCKNFIEDKWGKNKKKKGSTGKGGIWLETKGDREEYSKKWIMEYDLRGRSTA